jgi:hypothetical protein
VAALVHPVLHGIRIPIHQTKQREGEPQTRPPRCKDGYVALYRFGHYAIARLQIRESPIRNSRAFLRLQKSKNKGAR